jgi:hypothetical protein
MCVCGKWGSGCHFICEAVEASTALHRGSCLVPPCIKFREAAGTEQDAFSQNQFNFPAKISLEDIYFITQNQAGDTNSSAWCADVDLGQAGRDTDNARVIT